MNRKGKIEGCVARSEAEKKEKKGEAGNEALSSFSFLADAPPVKRKKERQKTAPLVNLVR